MSHLKKYLYKGSLCTHIPVIMAAKVLPASEFEQLVEKYDITRGFCVLISQQREVTSKDARNTSEKGRSWHNQNPTWSN